MPQFVHLHNHSHYSILDALPTIKELVAAAVEDRQPAIALTDHGVMYGTIEFYQEVLNVNKSLKEKGEEYQIKPIIGFEAYIASGSRFDKTSLKADTKKKNYYHLLLLAKDIKGYKNLIKLTSIGHLEGFYYRPRIDKEVLEKYSEGLICTSACLGGVVSSHLLKGDYEKAKEEAKYYKELFGNDFYLEIQNHFYDEDKIVLRDMPKLAKELGIKLVATNDIHYLKQEEAIAHNIMLHIRDTSGNEAVDYKKLRYRTPEFYFKTSAQMVDIFKEFPEAIASTLEITEKCNCQIDLKTLYMPEFPIPVNSKSETLDDYLRELVFQGLNKKYEKLTEEIVQRAEYELEIIKNMKFPGYFLIVWDFIRAAKERGVRVGPGRGSAAGSIVAYALDITNVDPLKYNLLFERFLNPDRISMPDIDIDFADDKRYKVIEYVKEKYGANAVAQIITFSKLSSRAVLTDVARVLSIPLNTVKEITSKIPVILGKVMPIAEAIELPDLKWLKETKDEKLQEFIEYSKMLENRNRGVSTHAAGVVIAPGEITDFVPVVPPAKGDKESNDVVTQYSMAELESAGLVKMDFLGLKTLSVIENTLNMIKENHNIEIDIDKIDFYDPDTYNLISEGHTLAVFQFESDGMQDYLRKLKPQNLEELTAMNALYRPGPMENIPEFIDRKFGRKPIEYLHPYMEESLKNTYGIIVYQEQVMQLVQKIAGFSLGQADILRRAMGKKKKSEMDKMKPLFIEGAKKNGINEKLAQEIFDLIEKFANYGFNKSHSLAYSYLAFQTAWLKTHYPAEFLAANMTNEINNQDKIVELIDEAKKFKIKVLAPDINQSKTNFIARGNVIYFGLAAIKNVGIPAVENIVQARESRDFTSFFDFVRRVDTSLINRRTIEALICAGAFDKLHPNSRASLFESIDIALNYTKAYQNYKADATDSLFGGQSDAEPKMPKLTNIEEWEQSKKLEKEKEYLNFYISGHPLEEYEIILKSVNNFYFADVVNPQIGDYLRVMGLVSEIRTRLDKNKNTVGFVTLEDFNSKLRVIFWSDAYSQYQSVIEKDKPLIVVGNSSFNGEFIEIVADQVFSIEEFVQKFVEGFKIWIDVDKITENDIEKMANNLEKSDKEIKIQFFIKNGNVKKNYIAFNQYFSTSKKNIDLLNEIFGEENVRLLISSFEKPSKKNGNRWNKN